MILQEKFKTYGDLFVKYGWVIVILGATTPLPFALMSFIAGYFKDSPPSMYSEDHCTCKDRQTIYFCLVY